MSDLVLGQVVERVRPGRTDELQVDFGKLGRIADSGTGWQRDLWALVFTPVVSRFSFVWLTHRQSFEGRPET